MWPGNQPRQQIRPAPLRRLQVLKTIIYNYRFIMLVQILKTTLSRTVRYPASPAHDAAPLFLRARKSPGAGGASGETDFRHAA